MNRYAIVQRFLMLVSILLAGDAALADRSDVIGRDGDFVAYANGVVADTKTGLEWLAGPDVDTTQTKRFTFLKEGRLVTITVGYYRLLYSKGETHWVCRSHHIFGVRYRRA